MLRVSIGSVLDFGSNREVVYTDHDTSISDLVSEFLEEHPDQEEKLIVIYQDQVVPREQWSEVIPVDCLHVNVVPSGDFFKSAFGIFLAALAFVLILNTAWLGVQAGTYTWASLPLHLKLGLQVSGALVLYGITSIFKVENLQSPLSLGVGGTGLVPGSATEERQTSSFSSFSAQGIQNPIPASSTPVPLICGTHRIVPNFGTRGFVYRVSDIRQGFRAVFDLGYGPLEYDRSTLRFGEALVSDFAEVEVLLKEGLPSEDPNFQNFPLVRNQRAFNEEMSQTTEPFIYEIDDTDATEAVLLVSFPQGLFNINRQSQTSPYIDASRTIEVSVTSAFNIGGSASFTKTFEETARSPQPFIKEYIVDISSANKIEVKVSGSLADGGRVVLSAITFVNYRQAPINVRGRATAYVDVKGSSSLSGLVSSFNLVATRKIPRLVRNPTTRELSWTEPSTIEASNPAWLIGDIFRGPASQAPVSESFLDLESLYEFGEHCRNQEYEFNAVLSSNASAWDRFNQFAAAGRGSAVYTTKGYGVLVDRPKPVSVDLITPRDTISFSGSKEFLDVPHGYIGTYSNRENDFKDQEITVFRTGYDDTNSTDLRTFDLKAAGITSTDLSHRFLTYLLESAVVRNETWVVRQDWKHLRLSRGDRIELQYDLISVGLGSARLTRRLVEGERLVKFSLDEKFPLPDSTKRYGVRFLDFKGRIISGEITEDKEYHYSLANPILVPDLGSMASVGPISQETLPALVAGISPQADFTADLTLAPLGNEIHAKEAAPYPPYDVSGRRRDRILGSVVFKTRDILGFDGTEPPGSETIFQLRPAGLVSEFSRYLGVRTVSNANGSRFDLSGSSLTNFAGIGIRASGNETAFIRPFRKATTSTTSYSDISPALVAVSQSVRSIPDSQIHLIAYLNSLRASAGATVYIRVADSLLEGDDDTLPSDVYINIDGTRTDLKTLNPTKVISKDHVTYYRYATVSQSGDGWVESNPDQYGIARGGGTQRVRVFDGTDDAGNDRWKVVTRYLNRKNLTYVSRLFNYGGPYVLRYRQGSAPFYGRGPDSGRWIVPNYINSLTAQPFTSLFSEYDFSRYQVGDFVYTDRVRISARYGDEILIQNRASAGRIIEQGDEIRFERGKTTSFTQKYQVEQGTISNGQYEIGYFVGSRNRTNVPQDPSENWLFDRPDPITDSNPRPRWIDPSTLPRVTRPRPVIWRARRSVQDGIIPGQRVTNSRERPFSSPVIVARGDSSISDLSKQEVTAVDSREIFRGFSTLTTNSFSSQLLASSNLYIPGLGSTFIAGYQLDVKVTSARVTTTSGTIQDSASNLIFFVSLDGEELLTAPAVVSRKTRRVRTLESLDFVRVGVLPGEGGHFVLGVKKADGFPPGFTGSFQATVGRGEVILSITSA